MYTAQEKQNAEKFVVGVSHLANGLGLVSGISGSNGHDMRGELVTVLQGVEKTWREAAHWFGDLLFKRPTAKPHYDAMLTALSALLAGTLNDKLVPAKAKFQLALTALSGFDWSLPYADPRHAKIPGVPLALDKTVVGPHGDWDKAVSALEYAAIGIAKALHDQIEVYRTVPVYDAAGNVALKLHLVRFAKQIDQLARAWSIHIEVEHPTLDKPVIDQDLAASPPGRGRSFIRTLRQQEILFNNRTSSGRNFNGRPFAVGVTDTLRNLYFQEFIVALARVPGNGPEWVQHLVVGDGNGGLHTFTSKLGDWWQAMDTWNQAAFGFYHPLPNPAEFTPSNPAGGVTQNPGQIPIGFFSQEVGKIETARAEVAAANERLSSIISDLRAKEG